MKKEIKLTITLSNWSLDDVETTKQLISKLVECDWQCCIENIEISKILYGKKLIQKILEQ